MRCEIVKLVLLLLSTFLVQHSTFPPRAAAAEAPSHRPNVVLFVADDLGWGDVGYHGSPIRTPHIDGLAREGVELDRFYVCPICSPTRVGLLTGRSPLRCGITAPLSPRSTGLPLDEHLLSQSFRAAGYQTWLVGKWHVGASQKASLPNQRGFDHSYGCLGGGVDYYRHSEFNDKTPDWHRNGEPVDEAGYATQLLANEAVRLIEDRDPDRPLLLLLTFNAPHVPLQAPEETIARYATIDSPKRRTYAAMVDVLDTAIGRVLEAIDREKLREETLILFFSDNGSPGRETGDNGPLAGGKGSVWEGGIRVPAAIRFPGVLEPGSKSSQVITVLDLFATLAAAAGIERQGEQKLDGRNVWPALRDGKPIAPRPFVVTSRQQLAVVEGDWKLIREMGHPAAPLAAQLFDLQRDPEEKQDVARQHPDVVDRLNAVATEMADLIPEAERPQRGKRKGRASK